MKKLLILMVAVLMSACCSKPSSNHNTQYNQYQVIDENGKWVTYKIDDTHFLCVPNYNADKGAVPVMLEVKKVLDENDNLVRKMTGLPATPTDLIKFVYE